MSDTYDFVAIGDVTIDAFIRLKEAAVHCAMDKEKCELCMPFGDKIPYEDVWIIPAVGNSANAAVCAARLGLKSALVSNIGNDANGEQCLSVLKAENVGIDFITVHKDNKTNYHYVLWYGDDRTILVKHEKYGYALPDIGSPRWLYLSSLGENTEQFHDAIAAYCVAHPEMKLAFQPGTFQIKLGIDRLRKIYQKTEVFFCNKDEAERITNMPVGSDIKELLQAVRAVGPKTVIITDGASGAYALHENSAWHMPAYPDPKPPYERTGAGDAFASTFIAALALGKPFAEVFRWAPINAMSVVQQVGARAGLLTQEKLQEYLSGAPADYAPREL